MALEMQGNVLLRKIGDSRWPVHSNLDKNQYEYDGLRIEELRKLAAPLWPSYRGSLLKQPKQRVITGYTCFS